MIARYLKRNVKGIVLCTWFHFRSVLKNKRYEISERGEIEVKGKGLMKTYFLLKNLQMTDEQIMGLVDGETCVYRDEPEDVTDDTKGNLYD